LMLSTVGIDKGVGVERFTFGLTDLMDGFSFLLLAMATFALGETLMGILKPDQDNSAEEQERMSNIGSMKVTREEINEAAPVSIRSSILGFFTGVLPGAGATIAAFLSYGMERNLAPKEKREEFGKGSIRGLVAPESANNAASSGS
ncbi:tripartite tricarboxylate transporter permease, partial [Vibrio fluvialis]|uniref:tripartite tricarboxylate transporter permease n=1 Tax=Vibrio fluvialis TaxID=676 RepID=UPI001EEBFC92